MVRAGGEGLRNLLLVVARAPLSGFTKTRLGESIGMEAAAQLHLAFLEDIANRFFASELPVDGIARGWAYTPESFDFSRLVSSLSPAANLNSAAYIHQVGENLGERLTNLFAWSNEQGFERTVIMASDSPQLSPPVICDAFTALAGDDLVIGRVLDGGYYLVGSRGFTDILSHVPMSTPDAAQALIAAAGGRGLTVAELPEDFDIDDVVDLELLIERLKPDGCRAPATFKMLQRLGFIAQDPAESAPWVVQQSQP